jgi:hypothetical protein
LLCKKIIVAISKEVKTGCSLVESSNEGYGSKRAVLLMMMMTKVHLMYEPEYVTPCVANLTEENSCGSMFEFRTGVWFPTATVLLHVDPIIKDGSRKYGTLEDKDHVSGLRISGLWRK